MEVCHFLRNCLSKSCQGKSELLGFGQQWRCLEGVVQPVPQIPISKDVQPQHRGQIGERPFGLREVVKPFQQSNRRAGLENTKRSAAVAGTAFFSRSWNKASCLRRNRFWRPTRSSYARLQRRSGRSQKAKFVT